MRRTNLLTTLTLLFFSLGATAQEVRVEPRIAGLEHHTEYMSLLKEDTLLQMREDSVAAVIVKARQLLRDDPANRTQYAEQIMQGENRIFELRNAKGRVIDRINTIEQEWVLQHMNTSTSSESEEAMQEWPDSLRSRNLVQNGLFSRYLAMPDYEALMRAQRREIQAVDYVNRFMANYYELTEMASSYAAVATELEATELQERFTTLDHVNTALADSLQTAWNYIYDNKSYAYDYLMEALGKETQLDRQSERYATAAREIVQLEGETASNAVVDYFVRKKALVEYETAVAEELGLQEAVDSLRGVTGQLATIDFKLPPVAIKQRYFLQYDSIEFVSKPRYTASNPIPECKIYEHGTIYRVLLGTFSAKRPVSIFRGTVPLSYVETDEGKWRYFAGGFATEEEAEEARKLLKKRGFTKPQVVVWVDGAYRNLDEDQPSATAGGYRIEIHGVSALPEAVREVLSTTEGVELSRVGAALFVVGTFADKMEVDRVAEAMRAADTALDVRVKEIAMPSQTTTQE
ncbi:MAG: SPOR domain-containing protein [Rikenellaceae bacterium]|nr:SPOR domain-containing protein [Rikenellaceae bacterium]